MEGRVQGPCRFQGRVRLSTRTQIYSARSPAPQQDEDGQLARHMLLGIVLLHPLPSSTTRFPTRSAMPVSLENQTFYNPAAATGRKSANRGPRVREGGPFAAILKVPLPPPLPQKAHDSQPSSAGGSQADTILIPSDNEFDDLDGRSDTSFESINKLLPNARTKVESGRVNGAGMCENLTLLGGPTY